MLSTGIMISGSMNKPINKSTYNIVGGVIYLSSLIVSTYDAYQSANTISRKRLSIHPSNIGNVLCIEMAYRY